MGFDVGYRQGLGSMSTVTVYTLALSHMYKDYLKAHMGTWTLKDRWPEFPCPFPVVSRVRSRKIVRHRNKTGP